MKKTQHSKEYNTPQLQLVKQDGALLSMGSTTVHGKSMMKRKMKQLSYIIVLSAAVFAAATSCEKEELDDQNPQIQGNGPVFYATLENCDTTTAINSDGYKMSWKSSDCISVNGTIYKAVPDKENPVKATFVKKRKTDPDPVAPFKVYYPASIYDSNANVATLPATQTYQADGNIAGIMPMYAESEDTILNFKNLCGLMKFTVKGTRKLKSIILTDDTKALSGIFTVSDSVAVLDSIAEGGITLNCGNGGVKLNDNTGKTFYVAVPVGIYKNLHVEYRTVDYAKMTENVTNTVVRNKVYGWDAKLYDYTADDFCGTYAMVCGSNNTGTYYSDTIVIEKFKGDTLYISGFGVNNPGFNGNFTPSTNKFKAAFDGVSGALILPSSINLGTLAGTNKSGPYKYDIRLSGKDWSTHVTDVKFFMKTKGTLTSQYNYFYFNCYSEGDLKGYWDVGFPNSFTVISAPSNVK